MPAGINIGDAVLTFLGDTTQLDAAFDRVGTEAVTKLAPAETAVTGLGESLQKTGVQGTQSAGTLADAFKLLPPVIAATDSQLQNMAFSLRNVAVAAEDMGEKTALAGVRGAEKLKVAEEAVGIRLPRGINRFLSELLPMGAMMDAAFAASVVFILIEALTKGIEKLVEWSQEAHKIALAHEEFQTSIQNSFNALDDKLLKSGARLDELRGDHMAALRKELELIDHQTLDDLVKEFDVLAKAADAVFKQLETGMLSFSAGSKGAENALTDFKSKYDFLLALGKDKEANDLLSGTLKSAQEVLTMMQRVQSLQAASGGESFGRGVAQVDAKHAEAIRLIDELKQRGAGFDEKAYKTQQDLVEILNAQVEAHKKINQESDNEKQIKNIEAGNKAEAEQERVLTTRLAGEKKAADEEDKLEDERRNHFIASMQEQEKEKIAATKQGSEERIKIIDAAIKEEEAHGFQDTAFYKSLQVERVKAVQARIDQEQKAQLDADKKQFSNAEQEAKREVEAARESGNEQEKAIQDLGKAKILSQSQTSQRLIAAYELEKTKVLAVLENLLHDEQALMQKAQNQLSAAKLNPAITPEQIAQAEALLSQLKNAVANTETQIAKVKSDANAKQLALDRSHYGQALALAIAFGNQELAANLKKNHDLLVAAEKELQAELKTAKSKGVITKATNDEIKALQHLIATLKLEEKTLEDTAKKGLSAWQQFGQGFRSEAQQNMKTMQEMGEEMRKDAQEFAADLGAEFAAMIQGQESFGQAMAHATEKLIGKMAQQWGEYYAAKAIADLLTPGAQAQGAAELAAATALFTIGSLLGSLAGAGGGSSKGSSAGSSGTPAPAAGSPALSAGSQPTQTVNVPHLSGGGLVMRDTLAVVHGGEGVLPLNNRNAMRQIAGEIAAQISMAGGGTHTHHIVIESDIPYTVKKISHAVQTHRAHLLSSDSIRHTPRS